MIKVIFYFAGSAEQVQFGSKKNWLSGRGSQKKKGSSKLGGYI